MIPISPEPQRADSDSPPLVSAFLRNPSSEFTANIDAPIEIILEDSEMESKIPRGQHIESNEISERT